MKVSFDHCYQSTFSIQDYHQLQKRGFEIDDYVVEHPGKIFCRFLRFNKQAGADQPTERFQYLEFVEVTDLSALKATYTTEVSDQVALRPGFSLRCDENLKALYDVANQKLPELKPEYIHKNYRWKEDSTSALPGWNFLSFDLPVVKDTYVWWTEYEPDSKRPQLKVYSHPNSVDQFHGFYWDLPLSELKKLQILTQGEIQEGCLVLNDGLKIYTSDSKDLPEALLKTSKSYPFSAVILTCTNWNSFIEQAKPDLTFTWGNRLAGLIKMPGAWDIVVLGPSHGRAD